MLPFYRPKPSFSILDALIALILLAAALLVWHRLSDGLNYRWEWNALPQYFFRFDPEAGRWLPNVLMQGFFTTIRLSIWATVFATLIGTGMGLLRVSRKRFRRWIGTAYVELSRNSPPLVLVFIFYFFIGEQLLSTLALETLIRNQGPQVQSLFATLIAPPRQLASFVSAVVTLSIFEGAYIAEIVRAGIQSIDRGQHEAAAAMGLTRWQRMRHVILPQAVHRILPPLGGQFISTIKDSAIVSVISIQELTFRGMELMSATYLTFETWIIVSGMYFVLTFGCSLMFARLEKSALRRAA
jgi:polar amino acid transport system permease protein